MKDSKQELLSFLADNTFQKIGLLGHTSADPDALAACFGMKFLLEKMHPSSEIDVLIDNYNKPSQKLIEYIDEPYLENTKKNYDLIIIVDVNSPEQLGKFTEVVMDTPANKRIIIDHHSPSDFAQKEVQIAYIEDKRTSTAEMITELLFDLDLSPPSKILTILLSGILYDSRRFYSLNLELVTILKKMLEGGAKYSLARDLIQREIGLSERFARLKSAKRSEYERIHGWIIVWTLVGAFEGSSARALIDVGADVVLVYSRRKNLSRLIVRATSDFYKTTNIHFGRDIMPKLADELNGNGGGHSTAAAVTFNSVISEAKLRRKTFKLLQKLISKAMKEKE